MDDLIKTHEDLEVWRRSIKLVAAINERTKIFPPDGRYGLVSQLRRSAISVPSNIGEGAARIGRNEFIHFLGIVRGSLIELQTQLIIADTIGISAFDQELKSEIYSIKMMINGLIRSLKMNN